MAVVRNSLWAASSGLLMTASRFLLTAVLARRMGVEHFGVYAYSQWLIDIGFLVCTFGVTGVASRYLAEYRDNPDMMVAILRRWRPFSIILPVLAAVVATASAWSTGVKLDPTGLSLLASWGIASGIWGMQTAGLIGLQRFDLVFAANLVASAVMLLGAYFIPVGDGPALVFGLMALASILAASVGARIISRAGDGACGTLGTEQKRNIYYYAFNIWLTALMWNLVWSRGEVPIIRNMLGDAAVAQYAVALTFYGGAVAGVMLGVSGLAPQITRHLGGGQMAEALFLCRRAMDIQLALSGLGALTLIWLGPELMHLAFGDSYKNSAPLLGILALGLPALSVASHNHFLQIQTSGRYNRNTTFLGVITLMLLGYLCVQKFGLEGGAASRAATMLSLAAITAFVCWHQSGKAAVSVGNLVGVTTLSFLSLLLTYVPAMESIPYRISGWMVCCCLTLICVRSETNHLVITEVFDFLRSRLSVKKICA